MKKERPNKIPLPRTIARHYAKGMFCDYPADIVLSAVNSHENTYDSVAVPLQLKFRQVFWADFEAYECLTRHNSENEISEFLASPDTFMAAHGIKPRVPIDSMTAEVMAVCADKKFVHLARSESDVDIYDLLHSRRWEELYRKKYPQEFFDWDVVWNVEDIEAFPKVDFEAYGFSYYFDTYIHAVTRYLSS